MFLNSWSWPGLSRPSTFFPSETKDVDARHKAGHDDGASVALRRFRDENRRAAKHVQFINLSATKLGDQ